MSAVRVRIAGDAAWPTARLAGEVDLSNIDELAQALDLAVANAARGLVVDLTEVTYLDSTGLRLVFRLARQLHDRQQKLCLVVPEESVVRRVLTLAGVASVADVVATAQAATQVGEAGP